MQSGENILQRYLKLCPYGCLLLDGALSTELEWRGYPLDSLLWSAKAPQEAPALLRTVHLDYLRAGADIITTASYQGTLPGFRRAGYSAAEGRSLLRRAVEIAREARDIFSVELDTLGDGTRLRPLVAASAGSYGAYLADGSEYRGDYRLEERELKEFHRERLLCLCEAGPELLALETLPSFAEIRALAELLKEEKPGLPVWFSLSCRSASLLADGTPVRQVAAWLDQTGLPAAVGINCVPPAWGKALLGELRAQTDLPLLIYPNAGESFDTETASWRGVRSTLAERADEWRAAGAQVIGGCCRTRPSDIRGLYSWRRRRTAKA